MLGQEWSPRRRHRVARVAAGLAALLAAPGPRAAGASGLPFLIPVQSLRQTLGSGSLTDVAVSPDGAHVYSLVQSFPPAIVLFRLAPDTDTLDFVESLSDGDGAKFPGYPYRVIVSPDGANVYVGMVGAIDVPRGVTVFRRDPASGRLTYLQTITIAAPLQPHDMEVSADGANLYVSGGNLVVFARSTTTGRLSPVATYDSTSVPQIEEIGDVALSPDGAHLYASDYGNIDGFYALHVFARNATTGALTFVHSYVYTSGAGMDGIFGIGGVSVSPDGHQVYAGSNFSQGITVFSRDSGTGLLTVVETETGGAGRVMAMRFDAAGDYLYVPNDINSDSLNVFSRNAVTGELTSVQVVGGGYGISSIFDVAVASDHVYAGGYPLGMFDRNASTGLLSNNGPVGTDGIDGAFAAAVSGDGAYVYVASKDSNTVTTFSRNAATGKLKQAGYPVGGYGARSMALSPDSSYVYVAESDANRISVWSRNAVTGALVFVQSVTNGFSGVSGIGFARSVVVSPDGAHVYVAGGTSDAVAAFTRNPGTGVLTFIEAQVDGMGGVDGLNGATGVALSPDGTSVYVTGALDNAVAVFSRNAGTGALTFVEAQMEGTGGVSGIAGATAVAVSPDGQHVYVTGAGDNAVALFARNAGTGALTFTTAYVDGAGGIDGLGGASFVTVSPDGQHVYVAGATDGGVAMFERDAGTGALSYRMAVIDGTGVDGLAGASGLAVSPNGQQVYATGADGDAVVTLALSQSPCAPTPVPGCRTAKKTLLQIVDNGDSTVDRITYHWIKGAATTANELGDPLHSTVYALCVYQDLDGTPTKVVDAVAPPGGACPGRDCWKPIGSVASPKGYTYRDRDGTPDGLFTVLAQSGATDAAKLLVKGLGSRVAPPPLPLVPPVQVEAVNTDGTCWTATFTAADIIKNEAQSAAPGQFKAKVLIP